MTDKENIIYSMCLTFRHDYGLRKTPNDPVWESGMTHEEANLLYNTMEQVYNHVIEPLQQELTNLKEGNTVLIPVNRDHAIFMLKLATMYLGDKDEPATN